MQAFHHRVLIYNETLLFDAKVNSPINGQLQVYFTRGCNLGYLAHDQGTGYPVCRLYISFYLTLQALFQKPLTSNAHASISRNADHRWKHTVNLHCIVVFEFCCLLQIKAVKFGRNTYIHCSGMFRSRTHNFWIGLQNHGTFCSEPASNVLQSVLLRMAGNCHKSTACRWSRAGRQLNGEIN